MVASSRPDCLFSSSSCFQLPSGSCSLSSLAVKKASSNWLWKGALSLSCSAEWSGGYP